MDNTLDKDGFTKRLNRYIQITGQVGGLLTRLGADKYLGLNLDKKSHALNLKRDLGEVKGPFMKIAQLLSMIPDAIPKEYANQLIELQSKAPSMGKFFVRRRMRNELGNHWNKKFIFFNEQASYAASLGQVHKGKLVNGELVACKLQYPDMLSTVKADLKQLEIILDLFEKYNKAIKTKKIHSEISQRLYEEIDYKKEIYNMGIFKNIFFDDSNVHIPEVFKKNSTEKLITMSWLEGLPVEQTIRTYNNKKTKERIAKNIFNAWYKPFYNFAVIHGDPHFGNYSFAKDGSVNLYDFGCIRIFPVKFVKAVIDLYYALKNNDTELCVKAYQTWGFKKVSKDLIKILNLWASYIYGPLLEDKKRLIQGDGKKGYGFDVANKVYKELKKVGGIEPPREFVFMDRAAIGMGSLFMRLDVKLNWHELFNNLIKNFKLVDLKRNQKILLGEINRN